MLTLTRFRSFPLRVFLNQNGFHGMIFPEHQRSPRHDWDHSAPEPEGFNQLALGSAPIFCTSTAPAYQHTVHTREYADDGDPLQDDSRLLKGLRITESDENDPAAVRKVPSEQALSKLRWGSHRRTSGRSKSGLQILVPGRQNPLVPIVTGKSIVYAYESSSSSSGRTTQSFGAIGDHLPSARSALPSSSTMQDIPEDSIIRHSLRTVGSSKTMSALGSLVLESSPDEGSYKLLAVGEVGPTRYNVVPHVVDPSQLVPQRRRSLSDLIEPPTNISSQTSPKGPRLAVDRMSAQQARSSPRVARLGTSDVLSQSPEATDASGEEVAPVWYRSGPPFGVKARRGNGERVAPNLGHGDFDPAMLSLPHGSKVFIMKSSSISNLRASVTNGVWSSTHGANRVLQTAWEEKKADQKLVILFSINHSSRHSSKYCGMAEMSGSFDPDVDPRIWIPGLKGSQGIIPLRWIVAKDVPFTVFENLRHKGKTVAQLRHANTVPGEVGRLLVQTYFEAEHSDTAVIHPEDNSPISPPGLVRRPRRRPHHTPPRPEAQFPPSAPSGASRNHSSQYGAHPPHGLIHRAVASQLHQQPGPGQCNGTAPGRYGQNFGAVQNRFYPRPATAQMDGSAFHTPMHGQRVPFFRH